MQRASQIVTDDNSSVPHKDLIATPFANVGGTKKDSLS